jgi:NAD(P)H-dependent flavin oxidoreductase YrpB (nitropropane dioxygenase family)
VVTLKRFQVLIAVPELAGAVARAGTLGMLCEYDVEPAPERIARALELSAGGAVGMGFFGQWIEAIWRPSR